ncbi:MAG TPA: hypothetical protein VLA37_00350 [Sphingomonadaceae bacterium]|nr:hypothetical protein [Sphingomonadaceae bacterium]
MNRPDREKAAVLDRFVPRPDAGGRHEITIHAPAEVVLDVARNFDMQSIPMIRAIFWLRAKVLGARMPAARPATGLVSEMLGLGWGCLTEEAGHFFVAGAACQPWQADVVFSPIAPEQFATYAEPDQVKIAWTLEAEALGPALTRFATETRVVATDDQARKKFRRYWRIFGIGIVMIRRLLLPALRREAERQWQAARHSPSPGESG